MGSGRISSPTIKHQLIPPRKFSVERASNYSPATVAPSPAAESALCTSRPNGLARHSHQHSEWYAGGHPAEVEVEAPPPLEGEDRRRTPKLVQHPHKSQRPLKLVRPLQIMVRQRQHDGVLRREPLEHQPPPPAFDRKMYAEMKLRETAWLARRNSKPTRGLQKNVGPAVARASAAREVAEIPWVPEVTLGTSSPAPAAHSRLACHHQVRLQSLPIAISSQSNLQKEVSADRVAGAVVGLAAQVRHQRPVPRGPFPLPRPASPSREAPISIRPTVATRAKRESTPINSMS